MSNDNHKNAKRFLIHFIYKEYTEYGEIDGMIRMFLFLCPEEKHVAHYPDVIQDIKNEDNFLPELEIVEERAKEKFAKEG